MYLDNTQIPSEIFNIFTSQYEQFNGNVSTLQDDIDGLVLDVVQDPNPYMAEDENVKYYEDYDPAEDYAEGELPTQIEGSKKALEQIRETRLTFFSISLICSKAFFEPSSCFHCR